MSEIFIVFFMASFSLFIRKRELVSDSAKLFCQTKISTKEFKAPKELWGKNVLVKKLLGSA